ncbi:hypothetical protein PYCCODRAFT_1358838 [Trametes coccinea BRFM310]|uniref:Uncharacterized protein n=1 Tax=Trametes coccinea (strain BRFM310) TaxID=1353009 RepID=A0A1Y2J401_TRAC3|nr:hypothetical protein PYCCODRAFT_1358838 [Trametes coccinea BRFM310]
MNRQLTVPLQACLLDTTGAFPRSLFSESEMNAVRWYALKNGVRKLPTIRQVKLAREQVLNVAGADPQTHEGMCGHLYTTNDLARLIKHEFANPVTRARLHLYSEDGDGKLREARQGSRWHEEVDPLLAGPMARSATGKDYYVNEMALANLVPEEPAAPVVIARWFMRAGQLVAKVHPLRMTPDRHQLVVDARPGMVKDVALTSFLLNVEDLDKAGTQAEWGLPAPDQFEGIIKSDDARTPIDVWHHPVRNPWRIRAAGRRVHAVPIWLYCDDTSGNVSKKWNKHNSILFVLGGLPQDCARQLHNVHFLSTSNIASPLEMMEQVTAVLKEARSDGIEVWDCLDEAEALAIPWVLAFQGDNPMASEFASHIGMSGRCICRVCEVYSRRQPENAQTQARSGDGAQIAAAAEMDAVSAKQDYKKQRLKDFLTAGKPRCKAQTVRDLNAQAERAFSGAPSSVEAMATETGTKDRYFQHFVETLQDKLNKWRASHKTTSEIPAAAASSTRAEQVREFLQSVREDMPENLFNPVLAIPADFDANSDSPLEVLHVVLLGVVKYWWRDAVSRQTPEGKEILKTRLSSLDVHGLGISAIRGHTLVYYAKSLVGRDFRIILQAAPAVLQGMVPDSAYEAWLALCRLAPLVYQDRIDDIADYARRVEEGVSDFLGATALWTTQWFNKPKFHLFVHLLLHIQRFGPAPIYATETFESYNLVIRLRSINSNKHAPSLNIARSFSHLHAVRHLLCGGWVFHDTDGIAIPPRQAGKGVLELLKDSELRRLMCMTELDPVLQAGERL